MMPKKKGLSPVMNPLMLTALGVVASGMMVLSQGAFASAFQLHENSAEAMGRAYAGLTTAGGDCSVVANNPASMSLVDGGCFQANITVIQFSTQFDGTAKDALGRPIYGGNGGDGGDTIPVPALFWANNISHDWHVGVGLTVPFGFTTEFGDGWKGRYNAIKSEFQSLDGIVSLSWDANDAFSLGLSAIAQRTSATLTSAINYNMVAQGAIQEAADQHVISPMAATVLSGKANANVPPDSDGLAKIKGDDWGLGWQIGVLWHLSTHDRLAFKYRAKISHTITGDATFTTSPSLSAFIAAAPAFKAIITQGGTAMPFKDTTGNADFTTPAVASVSYWHAAGQFGFGVTAEYTKWDVFKKLTVNYDNPAQPQTVEKFDWNNTWYIAIGADWYLNDKLTLRGGLAMDQTPTTDATRDPRVPDGDRTEVALGVGYDISPNMALNASYSHIFVSDVPVNTVSATGDKLVGQFDDFGNLFGVALQYNF